MRRRPDVKGFDAAVQIGTRRGEGYPPDAGRSIRTANPDAIFELEIEQLPGSEDLTVGPAGISDQSDGPAIPCKSYCKDREDHYF